jgi:hypothetical protein
MGTVFYSDTADGRDVYEYIIFEKILTLPHLFPGENSLLNKKDSRITFVIGELRQEHVIVEE